MRLHGIDAPELNQTFSWRGREIVCGTMSLAALEALIAGVKVRCEIIEQDRHGRSERARWVRAPSAKLAAVTKERER